MVWKIHSIIISKDINFNKARIIAQDIIKNSNRKFYKIDKNTYRFRNLPKTKFNKFRAHVVNNNISLIMGQLKPEYKNIN